MERIRQFLQTRRRLAPPKDFQVRQRSRYLLRLTPPSKYRHKLVNRRQYRLSALCVVKACAERSALALQQLRRRAQRHTTEDRIEPIDMPVDGRIVLAVDVVEGRRIEGLRFIWEASPDYLVRPWLAKRRLDLI